MDDTNKNAASGGTHGSGTGQGSGSDTLSAAKLASGSTPGGAGASPGAGGVSPTPGGPSGAGAQGHAGLGSGAQSADLASHT